MPTTAYDAIVGLPKSKSFLGSLGAVSFAALGGFAAGRLRGTLAGLAPTIKGAGSIGIFFLAAGITFFAREEKGWDRVLKEFAAGMAGFVGNDMWMAIKAVFGWGKWKKETDYKAGDIVMFGDKNEYYKATKDIPANPNAEPGKDERWVRFETAQAITRNDIEAFAQALNSDDALLDGLVKEQLLIFGPELSQQFGRDLTQDEADRIYSGMRDSLKSVVMNVAED